MPTTVLAVDAGGTQTRAALFDARGKVLAWTMAGPAAASRIGIDAAVKQIEYAVRECAAKATVVVVGAAGAAANKVFRETIARRVKKFGKKVLVDSDSTLALYGALEERPGVVLLAGTGSVVIARNGQGLISRRGGHALPEGDIGSALALGHWAIRELKLAPKRANSLKPEQLAGLSQIVDIAAQNGNRAAAKILKDAAQDLVKEAGPLLDHSPVVSYAGGMFKCSIFRQEVKSMVVKRGGRWKEPVAPPIAGGFYMGLREFGKTPDLSLVAENLSFHRKLFGSF